MGVAIQVIISKAIKNRIKKLEKAMESHIRLNKRIGEKALAEIDKQFRTEGTNFNTPWDALQPATIAARRKGSSKILRDTGRLAASITSQPDAKKVVVGSNLKYARNHQKGTTVPARPFLPEDKNLAFTKIAKPVIDDFMKEKTRKANGG